MLSDSFTDCLRSLGIQLHAQRQFHRLHPATCSATVSQTVWGHLGSSYMLSDSFTDCLRSLGIQLHAQCRSLRCLWQLQCLGVDPLCCWSLLARDPQNQLSGTLNQSSPLMHSTVKTGQGGQYTVCQWTFVPAFGIGRVISTHHDRRELAAHQLVFSLFCFSWHVWCCFLWFLSSCQICCCRPQYCWSVSFSLHYAAQ